MNKNSKLVTIIFSIVALALFVTAFALTLILDNEKAAVVDKENPIMVIGIVVSALGLIMALIDNHKMLKLVPIVVFALFALYIANYAETMQNAYFVANTDFFDYPVLHFLALILYIVSAVFMVKDEYKWAKTTFVVTSLYLATIIIINTMPLFYLFDVEGATHVSLYFIAGAALGLTSAVAVLAGYMPEAEKTEEPVEEEKAEEVKEESEEDAKAKEKAEIDEEVRKDVEAKFAEAEKKKQEENKESDDEVKLDFGEENN